MLLAKSVRFRPLANSMTSRILLLLFTFGLHATNLACCHKFKSEDSSDFVLCRQCGADVADASHLRSWFSPAALIQGNQTLFNRDNIEVQVLQNPLGIRFQIVTFSEAHCVGVENWHREHSWFPGYSWKHCLCPHCGHHLGWLFEPLSTAVSSRKVPSSGGFYALILDSLLSETFADSLMIVPRSYRS